MPAAPDPEPRWREPLIAAGVVILIAMVVLVVVFLKLGADADDEAQTSLVVGAPLMLGAARRPGSRSLPGRGR